MHRRTLSISKAIRPRPRRNRSSPLINECEINRTGVASALVVDEDTGVIIPTPVTWQENIPSTSTSTYLWFVYTEAE